MTERISPKAAILVASAIVGVLAVTGVVIFLMTSRSEPAPVPTIQGAIIGEPVAIELGAEEAATVTHQSGARIEVPEGAIAESATVSVAEVEPPISFVPVGRVFDFSVGDAQLLDPVTIHIPFDVDEGQDPAQFIALHWLEEHATWEELQGEINESERTIAVSVSDLSWFSAIFADWDCPEVSGDTALDIVPKVLEVRLTPEAPLVGDDIEVEFKVANAGTHCLSSVDGTGQVYLTSPGPKQSRDKLRAARVLGDKWKPGIAMSSTTSNGRGGDSTDELAYFTVEDAEPGRQEFRVELVFRDGDGEEIGRHYLSKELIVARGPELPLTYVRVEVDGRDVISWVEGNVGEDGAIEYTVSPDWTDELLKQKAIYTALASRELQSWNWGSLSLHRRVPLAVMRYGEHLVFGSKLALNALIVAFSPNLYSKARAFIQIPVDTLLKWKELNSPGTAKTITGAVTLEIGNHTLELMQSNQRLVERVKGRSRESGGLMTFAEALEFKNNQFYDEAYWEPVRLTNYSIRIGRIANWNDESDFLLVKVALVPFEHFFAGKVLSEAVEVVAVASLLGGLKDALTDYSPWNQMVSDIHGNLIDQRAAYAEFLDSLGIEDHEPFQLPVLTQLDIPHYLDLNIIDSQAPTPISTPDPTPTPTSTPPPPPTPVVAPPAPAGSDREALIALYNATNGPNWQNLDAEPWLVGDPSSPLDDWKGVTVRQDDANRVWLLTLRWNCLRGELPSSIGDLTVLESLFIAQNKASDADNPSACGSLEGPIPASLGSLTSLRSLYLSDNNLSGGIPSELGNPQSALEELYLANNRLSGEIPASLGNLRDLYVLDLSGNRLRGQIPETLANLQNLEELYLSGGGNRFTGCIPAALFDIDDHDLDELNLDPCGDDEDVVAPVTVQFSKAEYTVNENAGEVELTVTLSEPLEQLATVHLRIIGGTAEWRQDYGNLSNDGNLLFPANSTSQTATISILDDQTLEATRESFTVQILGLISPLSPVETSIISPATVTVVDNDEVTIGFQQAEFRVREGAGDFTLCAYVVTPTQAPQHEVPFTVHMSYTDPHGVVSSGPSALQFGGMGASGTGCGRFEISQDNVVNGPGEVVFSLDSVTSDYPGVASRVLIESSTATLVVSSAEESQVQPASDPSAFARNPAEDFTGLASAGNLHPEGIWSDGTTMWVSDPTASRIFAYDLATKSRVPGREFDGLSAARNPDPQAIWSDGTTMWVADTIAGKIFAYDMASKERVEGEDFNGLRPAGNRVLRGIWSDGTTMWVSDELDDKLFAYDLRSKERTPSRDFNSLTSAGNQNPEGMWSDGYTMWVADLWDNKIYAYDVSTRESVPEKEFRLGSDVDLPGGIWSNGTTMWAVATVQGSSTIQAYNMPRDANPIPHATPTPKSSASDLLSSVGEKLSAISTAKFKLVDETESGAPFFGATFKWMDVEVEAPDRSRMLVEVDSPGFGLTQIEMLAVGNDWYIRFSRDLPWGILALEEYPFSFGGLGATLRDLFAAIDEPAISGREPVNGTQTIRVNGSVASEELSTLFTSANSGHSLDLTLWFDEAEHTLRQIRITGQIFDDDDPGTQRLLTIVGIDVPVDIQPPDIASES